MDFITFFTLFNFKNINIYIKYLLNINYLSILILFGIFLGNNKNYFKYLLLNITFININSKIFII